VLKKRISGFHKLKDNVPFTVRSGDLELNHCCDCGLVHFVHYKVLSKKKLQVTMQRADVMTSKLRRHKTFKGLRLPKGR
jgi:uncharacterized Zn finger protein